MDSFNCVRLYPDIYQKLIILISIILINHAVEVVGLIRPYVERLQNKTILTQLFQPM